MITAQSPASPSPIRHPPSPILPTLTLQAAAQKPWDALIIGAGPAGSALACGLASLRLTTLLVDKSPFPRRKVCGCCLNPAALKSLATLGLPNLPAESGARPLHRIRLASGGWAANVPLIGSVSLSRESLDTSIVRHAIAQGAHFLPDTLAHLPHENQNTGDHRAVMLRHGDQEITVNARLVLAADGLGGHLLDDEINLKSQPEYDSRIGAGAVFADAPPAYEDGTIYMACARGGYVGLVRLEDHSLDIAAALDPTFIKTQGGPGPAIRAIIAAAGFPEIPTLDTERWHGTPKLSRRRPTLGGHRLLVLGDAAGYIEPFTGEGIAWALASGVAIAPLAAEAARDWSPSHIETWKHTHAAMLGRRQRTCRMVTRFLRHSTLTRAAIAVLSVAPGLAAPLVKMMAG